MSRQQADRLRTVIKRWGETAPRKDGLLDWRYRFPKLCFIEFPSNEPDGRRSYELDKLRANLEQAHREAIDDLRLSPAPAIILAYKNIYGVFPNGWPPWEFTERND